MRKLSACFPWMRLPILEMKREKKMKAVTETFIANEYIENLFWKFEYIQIERTLRCFIYHKIANEYIDLASTVHYTRSKEVQCQQAGKANVLWKF